MEQLEPARPLQLPDTALFGLHQTQLTVLSKTFLTITHKETHSTQPVYIVKNIMNNLLGFPAIKALKLSSHVVQSAITILTDFHMNIK